MQNRQCPMFQVVKNVRLQNDGLKIKAVTPQPFPRYTRP